MSLYKWYFYAVKPLNSSKICTGLINLSYLICIWPSLRVKLKFSYIMQVTQWVHCTWLCQLQLYLVSCSWLSSYLQLLHRARKAEWWAVLIYVRLLVFHKLLGFSLQQASGNREQQALKNSERNLGELTWRNCFGLFAVLKFFFYYFTFMNNIEFITF